MSETEEFEKPEGSLLDCEAVYRDEDGKLQVRNARLSKSGQE